MAERDDDTVLDDALRGMFRTLQARPVPEHLQRVVDLLDQPPEPAVLADA
jgi:hypothetical protein